MQDIEQNRRSSGTLYAKRQQLPWPQDAEFRILSIDGGGIRGILPATFLALLEERYLANRSVADYFDLIVGTSTGGILALGLAAGLNARDLAKLYTERGGEIFPKYAWWQRCYLRLKGLFWNQSDHRALEQLIESILGDKKLFEAQKRLCIPSIDANYGEVFVFKTPHHPDFKKDWREPMAKVARATSAAQSYFKPSSDETYTYLDGGIWANNPVMVGLVDALSCFDVPREHIRVLSLGCVESEYKINWWHKTFGGQLLWVKNVIEGSMHLQSMSATGQAGLLIGRDRLLRVDCPPITPTLQLDDWGGSKDLLPTKADELVSKYGERVAAEFFGTTVAKYKPLYDPNNLPGS